MVGIEDWKRKTECADRLQQDRISYPAESRVLRKRILARIDQAAANIYRTTPKSDWQTYGQWARVSHNLFSKLVVEVGTVYYIARRGGWPNAIKVSMWMSSDGKLYHRHEIGEYIHTGRYEPRGAERGLHRRCDNDACLHEIAIELERYLAGNS